MKFIIAALCFAVCAGLVLGEICTVNTDCVSTQCNTNNILICQHPSNEVVTDGGLCTCQDSSTQGGSAALCPSGWKSFQGDCYQFNTDSRLAWHDAATNCEQSGGYLVYIESKEEDDFLISQLKPLIDESPGSDKLTSIWTGGVDEKTEGSWVWYGTNQPIIEYTNWYPGQPDSGSGDHDEDCICWVGNHNYLWQDHSCREHMFWVCEMPDNYNIVGK
ncbi:plasmacytoid dendritic cell antigen processing and presentation [Mactra antiquata]